MWGGWLDDTHILHQSEIHTGPHGVGSRSVAVRHLSAVFDIYTEVSVSAAW